MNILSIIYFVLFILGCEIMLVLVFWMIKMYSNDRKEIIISIFKGILERGFLFFGLLLGVDVILILFGALKIGTRLHEDKKSKISNDLFLVGNILSVLLAIIYSEVWKLLMN